MTANIVCWLDSSEYEQLSIQSKWLTLMLYHGWLIVKHHTSNKCLSLHNINVLSTRPARLWSRKKTKCKYQKIIFRDYNFKFKTIPLFYTK